MRIENHRIPGIWHRQSSNLGAAREKPPVVIVLHYTAGWNGKASRDWLMGEAPFDKRSSEDAFFVARDAAHRRLARACARAVRAGVLDTESYSSDAAAGSAAPLGTPQVEVDPVGPEALCRLAHVTVILLQKHSRLFAENVARKRILSALGPCVSQPRGVLPALIINDALRCLDVMVCEFKDIDSAKNGQSRGSRSSDDARDAAAVGDGAGRRGVGGLRARG